MRIFNAAIKHSLLFQCFFSLSFTQHNGDSVVMKGVDAFFNYEFEESIEILSKARTEYRNHPVVHVVWAAAWYHYDQSMFSADRVYSNFVNRINEIEIVYDSLVITYPNNSEYLLYLGSSQSLKARIYLGQKKYLSTFYAAYQGFRSIQKSNQGPNAAKDVYLPLGVVEWYAGLKNPIIQIAARSMGITPSREEGIRKMQTAAYESTWAWIEAMSILAITYQFFDLNKEKGLEVSQTVSEKYPDNFGYGLYHAMGLMQNGKINAALEKLELLNKKIVLQRPYHQKRYNPYLSYLWANYYFLTNNKKASLIYLDRCINEYNSDLDIFLSNAFLLKGKIYDTQNKRFEAKRAYRKCIKLKNQTAAIDFAKQYLNEPFKG
ncbi:MAG: tetratricopeptide repeat protein [Candidatus Neomarinimicrobiota bacterium]|tara:strand:- start:16965 stop:18095 length:1131 start_codon:yes stop_codon:yes gene_type:complete